MKNQKEKEQKQAGQLAASEAEESSMQAFVAELSQGNDSSTSSRYVLDSVRIKNRMQSDKEQKGIDEGYGVDAQNRILVSTSVSEESSGAPLARLLQIE